MRISFRSAQPRDVEYCARLYFTAMEETIGRLGLDRAAHVASFRERWVSEEVRVITRDGADIGWAQWRIENDALFLAQIFIDAPWQRQGIGTEAMQRIIDEAADGQAVILGVVKANPALRLYRRLGFQLTHEDDRKFYMRREPDR